MSERTRFAPAPTGSLHVGGARTALFSWLVARATGGQFVVRLEDTDAARVVPGADAALLEDLRWLGLDWDEGPDVGGPHAPYRQSERVEVYRAVWNRLADAGALYPCYCTPEELEAAREADRARGRAPRYPGTCRNLSSAQRARLEAEGRRPAWRFAVPEGRRVAFEDTVHGSMEFSTEEIGDFVVLRSDGRATYDLACVADDVAMGITFVVRGDDHLANTARQILLLEAMGAALPRYAHLPLVTAPGGQPLSKSQGGSALAELRSEGFLPSAVVEYVASLGWRVPEGLDVRGPSDLVRVFDIKAVSPSPSVHDLARLRAMNAKHLRRLADAAFVEFAERFLPPLPDGIDREALLAIAREEAETGADISRIAARIASPPDPASVVDTRVVEAVRSALDAASVWDPEAISQRVKDEFKSRGLTVKEGMHALRQALIGVADGPPIASLLRALGPAETESRIGRVSLTEPGSSGDSDVSQHSAGGQEA
ncbi:MAG: glutamate--tRNA ligase [Anaerosomatales bacterium]|nr:glutamate--tRNA ligase [Anaerosomatales bacterium]